MSLSLRFLGTSAARPTVERNVSSIALVREGETLLFDCGEGTQRQMMRYGVGFTTSDIFFTHFHTDHVLGVIGLTRTMALQGRTELLRLYGPPGAHKALRACIAFGGERLTFPVEIAELEANSSLERNEYSIHTLPAEHRGASALGYALIEKWRLGRFNPDLAREIGIPEGPLWGQLHRGENVTLPDGRDISATTLVGAPRAGLTLIARRLATSALIAATGSGFLDRAAATTSGSGMFGSNAATSTTPGTSRSTASTRLS